MRFRHRRAAAIMILLASAIGCDTQAPGGPSGATTGPVTVSGRVLDCSTNAGVASAIVSFGTIDRGPFAAVGTATSNAAGSYTLSVPTVAQTSGRQASGPKRGSLRSTAFRSGGRY
jgi:hypothetical protein